MDRESFIEKHSAMLMERLEKIVGGSGHERTYGFEYEFLAKEPPTPGCVEKMRGCLGSLGFTPDGKGLVNSRGMFVTFEPGGQIEYHSPPLRPSQGDELSATLDEIARVNSAIEKECGISYLAVPYIPGRGDSQLCLEEERYLKLHRRLGEAGTRGHEMMKGTASVHLHALITDITEIPSLFATMRRLSRNPVFCMGPDRRDIWDNTDPARCGMPYLVPDEKTTPFEIISDLARVAADAVVLGRDVPCHEVKDIDFDGFLYHMTTIFTDVRLNMNAPTFELRTPDSMPFELFEEKWSRFIAEIENMTEPGNNIRTEHQRRIQNETG